MRRDAPATERNRDPILQVLQRVLPRSGTLLEVAAGTGQHALHFSRAFPELRWQPTDPDPISRASIAAWREEGPPNLLEPLPLDVTGPWPLDAADAVLCINMIHISPWEVTRALMAGAGRVLGPGGVLVTYGPYKRGGAHTSPSNVDFERWLMSLDERYGVRDLEAVEAEARDNGLLLEECVPMPANNFSLVFRRP